jgi:hypothetical protein
MKSELLMQKRILSLFKESNALKGGLADGKTVNDIAKKHNVPIEVILHQEQLGLSVEKEHADDIYLRGEIVRDHLWEDPYYYDKLSKAKLESTSVLDEMPYFHDVPSENHVSLDLQIEKFDIKELKLALTQLFMGEKPFGDNIKQPEVIIDDPDKFKEMLLNFTDDITEPANQFLVQFIRKYNPFNISSKFRPNVTLKNITKYEKQYVVNYVNQAYSDAMENKHVR